MASRKAAAPASSSVPIPEFDLPRPSEDSIPHWDAVDPVVIRALIAAATADGHAVLFGTTKDVSALTLTMYVGDRKASYVYGDARQAENACREYTEWFMSYRSHSLPAGVQ